ncbi:TRAP transporter small permease subunit [Chloroflexota bacterium]
MRLFAKVSSIFDGTLNVFAYMAGCLILFIMLAIGFDVVLRYFLNRPIIWVGEISEYTLLYITFLATAWLLRREGHVRMDIVLRRLTPKTQSLVNLITSLVGAIICMAIVLYGTQTTWSHFQRGLFIPTHLEPPKFILLLIIPLGSFLLFIEFIRRAYSHLESWRTSS